ncbi:hypothetical protein AB0M22_09045 [Nocardia sp. NPDC051756]|uniref:hypothetical protein n=1 Tax=Nocardia sp. NPDC051756 TaxID=3154751 RepID=UPI0034304A95
MTRKALVNEGCEDPHSIGDRGQAEGILKIHKPCVPPCPRKRAAMDFLGWQSSNEER